MEVDVWKMSEITGYSRNYLNKLARNGKLKARKSPKGHWMFDVDQIPEKKSDVITEKQVMERTGVKKKVIREAVANGDLKVKKVGSTTYIVDENQLYYLSYQWKAAGHAKRKWLYRGIPPHLKGALIHFVVDIIEEYEEKRSFLTPGQWE